MGALAALLGAAPLAQGALAQLGLTDASAAAFLMNEVKVASTGRGSPIAVAGTRAFLRLPRAARAAAATGLFAWAKAHVNSPAFKQSYAAWRNSMVPSARQYARTVQEEVKKELDESLAIFEGMRQAAERMPPAERAKMLAQVDEARARATNPQIIKQMEDIKTAERAQENQRTAAASAAVDQRAPADPNVLFARRLREFLDATSDVNFAARTISLTLDSDGLEFLDRSDRTRHWMWQEAALVGPEATAAARAAATAWLQEIAR